MAGRYDTDIRLDDGLQLTQATTGDAPVCSRDNCFMQDIRLEAVTQPGELFYAPEWGWGMLEFIQSEDDGLTRLEMTERVREKLGVRPEIDVETISVSIEFQGDVIRLLVRFCFVDSEVAQSMTVELSRVNVEVNVID